MSITPEMMTAMLTAGLSAAQIVDVVNATLAAEKVAADAKAEKRRADTAERVRRHRAAQSNARNALQAVTEVTAVTEDPSAPLDAPSLPPAPPTHPLNPPTNPELSGADDERDPPKAPSERRARRMPADFEPGQRSQNTAEKLGRSPEWRGDALAEMRDWADGSGARKVDWDATLAGWMRRKAQREPAQGSGVRTPPQQRPRSSQDSFLSRSRDNHDLLMEEPDVSVPFPDDAGSLFGSGGYANGHTRPAAQQSFGGDRRLPPPRLAGPPRPH